MSEKVDAKVKAKHVVIVGGGPVGALNACYLSKRGFKVDLYESRDDMRSKENAGGRSINLALSHRGIQALKHSGLHSMATSLGIPMRARMIHLTNGKLYPIPYGKKGQIVNIGWANAFFNSVSIYFLQHLLSVDRAKLNKQLLSAASACKNVTIHFKHKLISCNVDKPAATFKREDGHEFVVDSDVLFGCDGSYSAVRRQLQRGVFDYSQEYIPHGYKELTIPPDKDGNFAMAIEYLHIWPRHEYMLIALPNTDKSFTLTLFMPFTKFEMLKDGDEVLEFFRQVFPDAVPLIGVERLKKDFFLLPPLSLVSVKCSPYHYKDTVALFGDAAHAVVPFFGQGLNASLEDVLVFDEVMEKVNCDISKALPEYSAVRNKDGQAIADLSKQNYIEMRSSVVSAWFLFRKKVDNVVNFLFPSFFVPKYSMVAFTRTPYHKVILQSERQDKIINRCLGITAVGMLYLSLVLIKKYRAGGFEVPIQVGNFLKKLPRIGKNNFNY